MLTHRTVRSEIKSLEGQLRYLKDKVSDCTLTTIFNERGEITTSSYSFRFGEKFVEAIYNGWMYLIPTQHAKVADPDLNYNYKKGEKDKQKEKGKEETTSGQQ